MLKRIKTVKCRHFSLKVNIFTAAVLRCLLQYSMFHNFVCALISLGACVWSCTVSWYLAKSVWFCVSHPVSGKVVRLTDWTVWVPSLQLGCLSVFPSSLLPRCFLPLSHLHITLLHWWPAGQRIFLSFVHLIYLAVQVVRSLFHNLLQYLADQLSRSVSPCARARKAACDSVRLKCQRWQRALSVSLHYSLRLETFSRCGCIRAG